MSKYQEAINELRCGIDTRENSMILQEAIEKAEKYDKISQSMLNKTILDILTEKTKDEGE